MRSPCKQAFVDARLCCELTNWSDSRSFALLAAACAEGGDFAAAVLWQKKALEDKVFADSEENPAEGLRMYEQKKPFRLPRK